MLTFQAFKHIFMSPSSVDKESKATCSGNAHIHGMVSATWASIAYIAMQVSCLISINWILIYLSRFGLRFVHLWYSLVQTLLPTPNNSITLSLNSWMIQKKYRKSMIYWHGGTGASCFACALVLLLTAYFFYSQVFPNYLSAHSSTSTNCVLVRIWQKCAALRDAAQSSS